MVLRTGFKYALKVAKEIWFDNSSNGFTSTDTQSAIEEAKSLAEGFGRVPLLMLHNGTLSNGEEIGRNELMADKKYIFPVNFKITHLTWNNNRTSVDFDLTFYRYQQNGTPYAGNPFWTYEVRNGEYGYVADLNYTFNAGDYMKIFYVDRGTNCSDFEGELWGTRI
jgi:hypothetical protein